MGAGGYAGDGGRRLVATGRLRGYGGGVATGQRAVPCDGGFAPRPCANPHAAWRSRGVGGTAACSAAAECGGHSGWSGSEAAEGRGRLARGKWRRALSSQQCCSGCGGCGRGCGLSSTVCGCWGRGSREEAQARVLRGCCGSGRSTSLRDLGGGVGGDGGILGGGASGLRDPSGGRRVRGSGGSPASRTCGGDFRALPCGPAP